MAETVAPSRIARTLAGQLWPDVQDQTKLAPGIFNFMCAGHGGLVAVIPPATFSEEAIAAARAEQKIELVAAVHGRRTKLYTSMRYTQESLRELRGKGENCVDLFECWTGEEDCDWATITYARPDLIDAMKRTGCFSLELGMDYVRGNLERWNEDFLKRMEAV